jgi:CheY-like chemotaxis protein/HPt (histidine-containing phosphotransfer) domain-containing protein
MTRLLLGSNLNPRQRDHADTIARSAEALMGVINDLLDFSKIEAGHLNIECIDFNLSALLNDVMGLYLPRADAKRLTLRLECEANLPNWVCGDPLRVRQILLNLIDNAIKFTDKGEIRLNVTADKNVANKIHFSIIDTGLGMSEETQSRVFQAFSQADGSISRKYGGTGLGLTICRQLAELMGGELGLDSTPGKGSTFHLSLPLPVCALPEAEIAPNSTNLRFPGVTVLVAEDNLINQKLVRFMLENLGISVRVANDGKEAFDLLDKTEVDLVLMDCQMPEWDGLTATRALREREAKEARTRLTILALSAYAMTGYDEICRQAGMDDYLSKPIKEEDLAKALALWLPGRAVPAEEVQPEESSVETTETSFDLDKLQRICRNDTSQINEMLQLFVTSTESLLADLAQEIENRNTGQTARHAHQIKGAAAYLGAEAMTALASNTEAHAKAADWDACLAAQEDLEAAFIGVRLAIESHVLARFE